MSRSPAGPAHQPDLSHRPSANPARAGDQSTSRNRPDGLAVTRFLSEVLSNVPVISSADGPAGRPGRGTDREFE